MTGTGKSCRNEFSAALLHAMERDPSIMVVASDSRGSAALTDVFTALPNQCVEVGIAEQDAVGIAAGLAQSGKRVFVCGPACFYSARCLEQVKVDVAYADSDVKVIGISGGVSYGALGSTHHSLHDIAVMRTFPGLGVYLPCDRAQTAAITQMLAESRGPAYLRIGRDPVPDVYDDDHGITFTSGRACLLEEGNDCTIVAAGEMVHPAREASRLLRARGIRPRLVDSWSIKPLDQDMLVRSATETGFVFTVEEHSVRGGLGGAVAEVLASRCPVPMRLLGFPDEWLPAGTSYELCRHYGLDAEGIARAVSGALSERPGRGAGFPGSQETP
jgi:transketolase